MISLVFVTISCVFISDCTGNAIGNIVNIDSVDLETTDTIKRLDIGNGTSNQSLGIPLNNYVKTIDDNDNNLTT